MGEGEEEGSLREEGEEEGEGHPREEGHKEYQEYPSAGYAATGEREGDGVGRLIVSNYIHVYIRTL